MIRPEEAATSQKSTEQPRESTAPLRLHSARLNNVGGLLYQKGGDCLVPAMHCLQEGVQAMMCLEDPSSTTTTPDNDRESQVKLQLDQLLAEREKMQQERDLDRKPPARKIAKKKKKKTIKDSKRQRSPLRTCCNAVVSDGSKHDKNGDTGIVKNSTNGTTTAVATTTTTVTPSPVHEAAAAAVEPAPTNDDGNAVEKKPAAEPGASSKEAAALDNHQKDVGNDTENKDASASPSPKCAPYAARATVTGDDSTDEEEKKMEPHDDNTTDMPAPHVRKLAESQKQTRVDKILNRFDTGTKESQAVLDNALDEETTVIEPTNFLLGGIPGLFALTSRMRGAEKKNEPSMLVFSEPFLVDVQCDKNSVGDERVPLKDGPDAGAFYVPLDQCSRASLFNMGLVHYKCGSPDSAVQFFELSLSLAQSQPSLLTFDPISLACVNNVGQILLQNGNATEAKGMFEDALASGQSALVELYRDDGSNDGSPESDAQKLTIRLIRRFLVRSLMGMGFVHFFNCDYQIATRTCLDAMRLLEPHMLEIDAAALWYNISLSHHHQNELYEALVYLDKFLDVAVSYLGVRHLQVATALHRKGLICFEMGNLNESTKPMLQALRIRKAHWGDVHPLIAESLCLLGKIYLGREEFRSARNALLKALQVQQALNDDDSLSLDIAQTLIDLGRALHSMGQLEQSVQAYMEVVALTKKLFGARHSYVARMKKIAGNLFLEQGDVDQAVEMFTRATRIQVESGEDVDYAVVQNPHVRVTFSHHPTSASA